ncbi:hypothetical protein BRC77_05540 [Halobacteriales archaeon QH_8_64_26]|nr:MAG: hypothetical protein BRC77_05540 [Halobacteriales archaeon QH_8_64_26]
MVVVLPCSEKGCPVAIACLHAESEAFNVKFLRSIEIGRFEVDVADRGLGGRASIGKPEALVGEISFVSVRPLLFSGGRDRR